MSTLRIAINHSEHFNAMLVIPGVPPSSEDFSKLDRLKNLPIAMYVGEDDNAFWNEQSAAAATELERLDADVSLKIVLNEGHVIRTISGATLFDFFDDHRK